MKPYVILDCDQRSDAWKQARAGRITSTCADAMLARGRKAGEESVQRRDLRLRLCCERLTGVPQEDGYTNRHMEYGALREADAFAAYEATAGVLVRRTGFLSHTELLIGASLDGDVDDCLGIVELKCPKTATHVSYLRDVTALVGEYQHQIAHQLYVTGAEWADLVSFDDRLPAEGQLVVHRIRREQIDLKAYNLALRMFLKEVDDEMVSLQKLLAERAA